MNRINLSSTPAIEHDLTQFVEPLASLICAAEQPEAALNLALAALFNEVQRTNCVARAHVAYRQFGRTDQ